MKAHRLLYLILMIAYNSDITPPLWMKKLRSAEFKLLTIMELLSGKLEFKPKTTCH